ncbi:23 kDa integral membrane protein-like [Lytechinus pictus]|uniref:23 kDa integral membrane protein-like n=1 Tax=Lytechinus pictus TaxID=7653 RepID=UPI00240CFD92|nr:23 kDa integral membrane protein-like [Lytechinus pictus]XP_054752292.1 23 kDa integral membrane protein-like [Lytechinus pictus]
MCTITGIKVLLFIENFIFWLLGSSLLGLAVYILVAESVPGIFQIFKGATTLCYVAIGAGAFLFFLGLVGCCGAAYHNDCLLKTYIFVLILLILAEIGIGIYIGLGFGEDQVRSIWNGIDEGSKEIVYATFKCCGVDDQACVIANPTYEVGCIGKLRSAFKELNIVTICVAVAAALLQILAIIMSCFLACNRKEHVENQVVPLQPRGGYR